MNSSAFAPIPIMLLLSNKLTKAKGFKFTFCAAVISFVVAMLFFMTAYVHWINSFATIFILSIIGSIIGSFGIGTFFAFPYMVPAQIAAEETQRTGKSNSAMFYGVQGTLVAISSSLNDPV
jgi:Na+/melibiose symporter-like transporter